MRHVYVMHRTDPEVAGDWLPPPGSIFLAAWSDPGVSLAFITLDQPDQVTVTAARAPTRTVEASTAYEDREATVLRLVVKPALDSMLGEPVTLVTVPAWA